MDFREAAVLRIASRAHEGDDIQTEFMLGQGQAAFGFRTIGFTKLWTAAVEAAANLQRESQHGLQGREGTVVVISSPHGGATARTVTEHRNQGLSGRWERTGRNTCHRPHLQSAGIPMVSGESVSSFSPVCYPSFFKTKRTLSRPSWTPVWCAKTVAMMWLYSSGHTETRTRRSR